MNILHLCSTQEMKAKELKVLLNKDADITLSHSPFELLYMVYHSYGTWYITVTVHGI